MNPLTPRAVAIERFLSDLKASHSPQTVATYAIGVARFNRFLSAHTASALTVDDALNFARGLAETELAKTTRNTYLAAVSKFFFWLVRENMIAPSAADLARFGDAFHEYRRKTPTPLPKTPSDEMLALLLRAARRYTVANTKGHKMHLRLIERRNLAIVEALRASGMRVGELVTLKIGDLDVKHQAARVLGKGDKGRLVYFDSAAWKCIHNYLDACRIAKTPQSNALEAPVFRQHRRNSRGKPKSLTTDHVAAVFRGLCQLAGITSHLTPHSLRHYFATRVLETTGNLAAVQDLLGHQSPTTTRRYAQLSNAKLAEIHRQVFLTPPMLCGIIK